MSSVCDTRDDHHDTHSLIVATRGGLSLSLSLCKYALQSDFTVYNSLPTNLHISRFNRLTLYHFLLLSVYSISTQSADRRRVWYTKRERRENMKIVHSREGPLVPLPLEVKRCCLFTARTHLP